MLYVEDPLFDLPSPRKLESTNQAWEGALFYSLFPAIILRSFLQRAQPTFFQAHISGD